MTNTERRVWSRLSGRQVDGHKFRRQVPVGPYFVDFLCVAARLVMEVDGAGHEEESDTRKTDWLNAAGYRVLRIPAADVDESIDDVIHGIYLQLSAHAPTRPDRAAVGPTSPRSGEANPLAGEEAVRIASE